MKITRERAIEILNGESFLRVKSWGDPSSCMCPVLAIANELGCDVRTGADFAVDEPWTWRATRIANSMGCDARSVHNAASLWDVWATDAGHQGRVRSEDAAEGIRLVLDVLFGEVSDHG